MPKRSKFTKIMKADELVPRLRESGVGLHVLPTYHVLCDHANNDTGRAWPSVNRIASILGVCRRTVERHIKDLVSAGLVLSNGQSRSKRGRFSVCRYCVVAVLFFTRSPVRHQGRTKSPVPNIRRTRLSNNLVKAEESLEERRQREAERRSAGYGWFFQ